MSYDLRFVPRPGGGSSTASEIASFLRTIDPSVTVTKEQVVYENECTGVYFLFEFGEAREEPLYFALNVIRPSVFALEAIEVLERLVERFALDVIDDQGGSSGPFDARSFFDSWTQANLFGCRSIVEPPHEAPKTLPRETLIADWNWNRFVQRTDQVVDQTFAARVMYRLEESGVRSYAVIVEDNPTITPLVDDVILLRPKKAFLRGRGANVSSLRRFSSIERFAHASIERQGGQRFVRIADTRRLFEEEFVTPYIKASGHGAYPLDNILDRETVEAARKFVEENDGR